MEMLISLVIQIISGAIGGQIAGLGKQGLGTTLNTVVGGVGGLVLGQVVALITGTAAANDLTLAALASNIIGGGVGGLVLTFVVGWIKNRMATK
ncbi:hypothetical protein GNF76_11770 [Pseudomonas sp. CCM 7893]|uniref:DNA methyltransferase n=1 Tax=Pseudomonas spelaei TaxID=1055469 RepID=A0A6I3W390_9PSED|nr:hypothetical protein [Pseudomonas spelaei]MUF05020.1 hypothetical protein [Pseudomonas spelaei]QLG91946.1 hypothetical protein HZF02_08205 [Pseudomonas yamanorum]